MKAWACKYDKQISFGFTIMLPGHAGDKHWDIIIDFGIFTIEFRFNEETP